MTGWPSLAFRTVLAIVSLIVYLTCQMASGYTLSIMRSGPRVMSWYGAKPKLAIRSFVSESENMR